MNVLEKIEIVYPKLQEYALYKSTSFDQTERDLVKEIVAEILPQRTVNWNCNCNGELLILIMSYYQRESQKPAEGDNNNDVSV
jgi:hypothetical protein